MATTNSQPLKGLTVAPLGPPLFPVPGTWFEKSFDHYSD
jgi:hypothetical protein